MPGTFRYSASLDKTYRDEETGLIRSAVDLDNQNCEHKRTCSMDSLDSISSSGGSLTGSSCNGSGGAHSRQVSTDSTSSPTNLTSPNSYVNNKLPLSNIPKVSYNPHQFIKAGPSVLHKSASDQIKAVKEVVKTYRTPVKEEEEEWQQNLSSWKSKRRGKSESTFQRVDEMKQLDSEENSSESPRRKSKTFSQMCQDKARRPSGYNLAIYSDFSNDSNNEVFSEREHENEESLDTSVGKGKDPDGSFDDNSRDQLIYDNSNKDKDDGYSSKDECNKTETDDQSDTAANDDQILIMTSNSVNLSEPEILPTFTPTVESFQETVRDADCSSTTSATNSSEDDFPSTAFHESDYAPDDLMEESQSTVCMNENEDVLFSKSQDTKDGKSEKDNTTLILTLKPPSDVKDFGFTMTGGKDCESKVLVESVAPKGAAEKAGLLVGDVINTINGEETFNRSHSALVFAIKQAGYTGQLQLDINRTSSPEDLTTEYTIESSPKPKPTKGFHEKRAMFLQKENKTYQQSNPSRDSVSRRKNMFDSLPSQEASKRSVNVDVRLSLRDRVASFESIEDSTFKKHPMKGSMSMKNIHRTPPAVTSKPKSASVPRMSSTAPILDVIDKEYVLTNSDLIETIIDSKSDSDDHTSDSELKHECGEHFIMKEKVESGDVFKDSYLIPLSENDIKSRNKIDQQNNQGVTPNYHECQNEPHDQNAPVDSSLSQVCNKPEVLEEHEKNIVQIPENRLEQLCYGLSTDSVDTDTVITNSVEKIEAPLRSDETSSTSLSVKEDMCSDEGSIEDVSDALEEALALIDDFHLVKAEGGTTKNNSSMSEIKSSPRQNLSDLNIIYDSNIVPASSHIDDLLSNNEFLLDDNFDRPRSVAEPPKEKPPPPPIDLDTSPQYAPPMKRLNSTKRIKKEISRRRSDFLGLGDPVDDTVDIDEVIPKPPRQIDDLIRSELEMEKSLPSPTLSSDYAELSNESQYESTFAPFEMTENPKRDDDIEMQEDEEKHIRELEEQRIHMQEARRKAEQERLLQERVEQMRKKQEMLMIEKERLKREQNEVMKARSSSESSTSSNTNSKSPQTNVFPIYNRNKTRPRAPPPPPPKPLANKKVQPFSPEERGRSEVIRLSRRPTSGDFSGINLSSSVDQPIQKQPLSRHSLQSLSAVPKANLSNSDSHWMKREAMAAKRKPDTNRKDTYSHWLIQEAEMRRIAEQTERKRVEKQTPNSRMDFSGPLTSSKSESNIAHDSTVANSNKLFPDSANDTLTSRVNKINVSHQALDMSPLSNHDWSPHYQITRSKSTEMNTNYGSSPEHVSLASNYGHYRSDNVHNSPPMHAYYQNLSSSSVNNSNYMEKDVTSDHFTRSLQHPYHDQSSTTSLGKGQDNMLSVSGRKKCSNCLEELGRGAAMIIESLKLFYHIKCFRCSVCQVQLGNGSCGADVRVRNHKLHCQNCYSNDEAGLKFSKV